MATFSYKFNEAKSVSVVFLPDTFDLADLLRVAYTEALETMEPDEAYSAAVASVKSKYCYVDGVHYPVVWKEGQTIKNVLPFANIRAHFKDTTCDPMNPLALAGGYLGVSLGGVNIASFGPKGLKLDPVGQLTTLYCEDDETYTLGLAEAEDSTFELQGYAPNTIPANSVIRLFNICISAHEEAPVNDADILVSFSWEVMSHITETYVETYYKEGVWPPYPVDMTGDTRGPEPQTDRDGGNYLPFLEVYPEFVHPYMEGMFKGKYYNPKNTKPWNYVREGNQ